MTVRMTRSIRKFSSWVPVEAQQQIKDIYATHLRPQICAVVHRLATDLRMQIVWTEVARYGPEKAADVIECVFMRAQQAFNHSPPFPRRKKDQEAHLLAEMKTLKEPGARRYSFKSTAIFASWLIEAMQDTEGQAENFGVTPEQFHNMVASVHFIAAVYNRLSAQAQELNRQWPLPRIGKLAAVDAPERLFSVAISQDFKRLFGRSLDPAVAALTNVVFDSGKSPGSEIIRGRRRRAK